MTHLPPDSRAAIDAVAARARSVAAAEREFILDALVAHGAAPDHDAAAALLARIRSTIATHATIALNFHPDRVARCGRTVARALREEGRYRSQFDTGLSNGSVTAFPGGDRDRWEELLFDGAYHAAEGPVERPKYGAWEWIRHPEGPAPRFGSCAIVLAPEVSRRATFTVGDSHVGPTRVGTLEADLSLLAGVIEDVIDHGDALGARGLTLATLLDRLETELPAPRPTPAGLPLSRNLDAYLEAQVHGPIELARDATTFVLDPSFRGTEVGGDLLAAAAHAGCAVHWHAGSRIRPANIPIDFRGADALALARSVAGRFGTPATAPIDDRTWQAATIGEALAALRSERGAPTSDELQLHKYLWHALIELGEEVESPA